jgi:hypothetical protein
MSQSDDDDDITSLLASSGQSLSALESAGQSLLESAGGLEEEVVGQDFLARDVLALGTAAFRCQLGTALFVGLTVSTLTGVLPNNKAGVFYSFSAPMDDLIAPSVVGTFAVSAFLT